MPTIVIHRETGDRYVLVGTGFAASETATPSALLGNLSPDIETKAYGMVALCDGHGTIHWRDSREYLVAELEGHSPAQWLAGLPQR